MCYTYRYRASLDVVQKLFQRRLEGLDAGFNPDALAMESEGQEMSFMSEGQEMSFRRASDWQS